MHVYGCQRNLNEHFTKISTFVLTSRQLHCYQPCGLTVVVRVLVELTDFELEEEAEPIFVAAPDASAGATAATAESLVWLFFFAASSLALFAICSFIIASTSSLTSYSLNERLNWVTCDLVKLQEILHRQIGIQTQQQLVDNGNTLPCWKLASPRFQSFGLRVANSTSAYFPRARTIDVKQRGCFQEKLPNPLPGQLVTVTLFNQN